MERTYPALASHPLPLRTSFQQAVLPTPGRVTLEDAAIEVFTDFRRVRAITVPPAVSVDYASHRMRANRIHLLLVSDELNVILGLVTSTDIEGERPVLAMQKRGVARSELQVADIMTPADRLEAIDMVDVLRAQVGHIVATLKAVGRQHAMVIDRDETGRRIVRGLFSVSQLNAQLGESFQPVEIARTFAAVEAALAHR